MADRPFAPTPSRLALARHAGLNPYSPILTCGLTLAFVLFARDAAVHSAASLAHHCKSIWDLAGDTPGWRTAVENILTRRNYTGGIVADTALGAALLACFCALVGLAQIGPRWTGGHAAARRKLGTSRSLSISEHVAICTCAIAAVFTLVLGCLWSARDGLVLISADRSASLIASSAATMLRSLLVSLCLALLVAGLGDVIWRRAALRRRLHMTRAEMLREDHESRTQQPVRRGLYAERSWAEQLHATTRATVILTNGQRAAALRYGKDESGQTDAAPIVVASASGQRADTLREIANTNGIECVETDEDMLRELCEVGSGQPIPPHWYPVAAKILESLAAGLEAQGRPVPWTSN